MRHSCSRKSLYLGENFGFFLFTALTLLLIKAGDFYGANATNSATAYSAESNFQRIADHEMLRQ
ncbi:MAG: hypothetical protein HY785_23660 [Oscillatoriophycideae cyanobacterium NC_groundwater_1537_Pr4_S-0.65um_50_18]|nr:hypothetical protein [Oscillatoriophycideae cyanobacterium NC_groundwater_1537_Pr4_S-0.65um_50_18]